MATNYLRSLKDGSPLLSVNYSFVQSFHVSPTENKALNEGYVIRNFIALEETEKMARLAIMKAVYKFCFMNKLQISRHLSNLGITVDDLDALLKAMVSARQLNFFFLAEAQLPDEPEDGEKIYCTDLAGRYILSHYHREDAVMWKMTDNARSAEQVIKYLSAVEFYFSLTGSKNDSVRVFEPVFNAPLSTRNIRFSAYIEMKNEGTLRRFILESVREADVPVYFRKKVIEQIAPFSKGQYKKALPELPEFIFLCENLDVAIEAADIYFRYFESADFYVTTDEEIAKGMKKAAFYNVVAVEAAWHSFPWFSPDWIVVVVLNVCNVIENCFVHKPLTIFSFFWFNLELCGSEVLICKICNVYT